MSLTDPVLDRVVLSLSDKDVITVRDLVEGVAIFGAPGSGKTSTSGKQFAMGLLRIPNSSGLVLVAKPEETRNWIAYAKACGREKDLIIFNATSGHAFDPLHYAFTRPGRGAGDSETVIDFFDTLMHIGRTRQSQVHDDFWDKGVQKLERNVIKLLHLAGEPISIASMDKVIRSLPTRVGQEDDEQWAAKSYCAQLIEKIRSRKDTLTEEDYSDLDIATTFIFESWPEWDDRPRSSLLMTWSGTSDRMLFNPLSRLFCQGRCSFTPESTIRNHQILVVDFPLLEFGHITGQLISLMMKLTFQRAWLRRDLSESPYPVFCFQDEFQYFVAERWDGYFQQTCRGSRAAVVSLTQNILNLSEVLGEDRPGSKTKSWLGNTALKVFHQNNETDTNLYGADLIGQEYRYLDSYHAGAESINAHAGIGGNQHLAHLLEPIEFSRLKKPSAATSFAEAIVYQGKNFEATKTERNPKGLNYLRVLFSRE